MAEEARGEEEHKARGGISIPRGRLTQSGGAKATHAQEEKQRDDYAASPGDVC